VPPGALVRIRSVGPDGSPAEREVTAPAAGALVID
jgi:hypothetical protein